MYQGQAPVSNNEKANNGAGANNSATTSAVPTPVATSAASTPSAAAGNLQSFSGALGGITAPVVTALGSGEFQVQGNASFKNQKNAVVRSCDVQNNQCANAANASGNKDGFTVSACNAQKAQCIAAAN
ncbi:hypothetical protein M413DRAFT_28999 [Hebeloma cylindrosporum]|uniref:Uncharacterized protein n=1 Tax=Hebeloma cylindrosporum TaxID=76867 RepID=A0A0C2XQB8_HEBCY|nr:hypothetical protein M413DRAFT_28999 [Hebeloma cylindrosporum h7]